MLEMKNDESKQKCLLNYLCKQMGYDFAVNFHSDDAFNIKQKRENVFNIRRISCDDGGKSSHPTFDISKESYERSEMVIFLLCGPYTGVCPITEKRSFLMRVCFEDFDIEILQCPFSQEIYTTSKIWSPETFEKVDAKCDNDPHFYQGCGLSKFKTFSDLTINEAAICGDFICSTKNDSISALKKDIHYLAVSFEFVCGSDKSCVHKGCPRKDLQDCRNQEIPENFCSTEYETVQLPTGRSVPKFKVCNGRCDDHYSCEDEAMCGGYIYGTYCLGPVYEDKGLNYIKPIEICDGQHSYLCLHGEDERDCPNDNASLQICDRTDFFNTNSVKPLTNRSRCSAPWKTSVNGSKFYFRQPLCSNFFDQTNCTDPDRSTVICRIRGMMSNISKFFVCHGQSHIPALCDNGIDQECTSENVSLTCKLHRHQLCDSIIDCPDGSDEKLKMCRFMTERTCYRSYKHEQSLTLPLLWLGDGIEDCLDSIDEKDVWPSCGIGRTKRFVTLDEQMDCGEVFLCSHQQEAFVQFRDLCDGINSCGNENSICDKSQLSIPITNLDNVVNFKISDGLAKLLIFCLPGLRNLQSLVETCVRRELNLFEVEVFGVKTDMTIFIPDQKRDCDYIFGETYVILSCAGYCRKSNCPIKNTIRYDSCPGQYPDRVYTLANNKYLTFATKSQGGFKNEYFLCDNGFCISMKYVCNLIDECGDGSDENNCTNSLMCDSKEQQIFVSEKCDGKIDCLDFSDECNSDCGRQILHNSYLKGSCWSFALLATVLNMFSIKRTLSGFKLEMSKGALNNKMSILLVNIGDLVIGVYLLQIAVVDSIIYGKSYCRNQLSWLSSSHCNAVGVISTAGYEISLISVTALGIVRVFGIRNRLNVKCKLTGRIIIPRVVTAVSIIALSLALALIPLMHQFEDFFVNGMTYKPSSRLFIGSPGKGIHLNVIQEYYGKVKEKNLKWRVINDLIDGMFSHDYLENAIGRKKLEFYGNEGVCLFKFFVKSDDPQCIYSWLVLAFNMALLGIVSACYILINKGTKKNTRILIREKTPMADNLRKRNRKLQRKISLIIASDLVCWLPVTIVSCLHSADVFDATPYYALISIVFLPVNSVINPIFYNETITKAITIWVKWLHEVLKKKNLDLCFRSPKVFPATISPPALPGIPLTYLSPTASPLTDFSPPASPPTDLSPSSSPVTDLSPPASPLTDLSPPASPLTDLSSIVSPPASPLTDLSPPASPFTNSSHPESPLTDLSPSSSPVTDLSPPASPLTDLSPPVSTLTDLSPIVSPPASPLSDLSPPASPLTDLSPPASPLTDLSHPDSPLSDLSPSSSPVTDLSPPVSPLTDLSPPESPHTESSPLASVREGKVGPHVSEP